RLVPGPDDRLESLRERLDVRACQIEHLEFEPAKPAQTRNSRRVEAGDNRSGNGEQRTAESSEYRLRYVVGAFSLIVRLQANEHQSGVRPCPAEAEAHDRERRKNVGVL